MAHIMHVCDCGNYQVFNHDDEITACSKCGTTAWAVYSKEDYLNSEHWRMICLARHVLKQGGNSQMRMFLNKFEKRNGSAITIKLKEFCRIEYEKAGGQKRPAGDHHA